MKLKYLWVEKYKNLQNFECNFSESGLDVLIGTNGSGKSNVLEVISYIFAGLYKETNPKMDFVFKLKYLLDDKEVAFTNAGNEGTIKLDACDVSNAEYTANKQNYLPKNLIALYSGESTRLFDNCFKDAQNAYNKSYWDSSDLNIYTLQMIYNTYRQWNIFALLVNVYNVDGSFDDELEKIHCKGIKEITFTFNLKNLKRNKNVLVGGLLSVINPSNVEKVVYTGVEVEKLFLELIQFDREELFCNLNISLNSGEFAIITDISVVFENQIELIELSEGEKKYISLLGTYLLLALDKTLILLDEPDVHLHETRKHMLSNLIKEKGSGQTLLTTHSSILIKDFDLRNEIILTTDKGKTVIADKDKMSELLSIAGGEETITALNGLLESKKIVLMLEGKTDIKYLKKALENYAEQDDKYKQIDFDIISFNGTGNAKFFIDNFQLLAPNRKIICALDRDSAGLSALNMLTGKSYQISNDKINKIGANLVAFLYPPAYGKQVKDNFLLEDYFKDDFVRTIVDNYISDGFSVRFRSKPTLADEIKNKIEVQFDNGTIPDVAFEGFKILLDKLIEAKDSLAI